MGRHSARFVLALLAAAFVAAGLTSLSSAGPQGGSSIVPRTQGRYVGKTAQGLWVAFIVSKTSVVSKTANQIAAFTVKVRMNGCPDAGHTVVTQRYLYDMPIRKARFSRVVRDEGGQITLVGRFTSSTAAKGSVHVVDTREARACDAGIIAWKASWEKVSP